MHALVIVTSDSQKEINLILPPVFTTKIVFLIYSITVIGNEMSVYQDFQMFGLKLIKYDYFSSTLSFGPGKRDTTWSGWKFTYF